MLCAGKVAAFQGILYESPSPLLSSTCRNLYLVAQKGDRILLDLPLLCIRDLVSTTKYE